MRIVRGLTLIELLIAMAVVAVLASLAVPALQGLLARHAVDAAVSAFIADLNFARSEALKLGHSVTICRSSSGTACEAGRGSWHAGWIVFRAAGRSGTDIGPGGVLRVQGPLAGLASFQSSRGPGATDASLRFNGRGIAVGAGNHWVAAARGGATAHRRVVCLSFQGRASVQPEGAQSCGG